MLGKRRLQRLGVELRVGARARKPPDIGEEIDAGGLQQRQQLGEGPRRMTDGVNEHDAIVPQAARP